MLLPARIHHIYGISAQWERLRLSYSTVNTVSLFLDRISTKKPNVYWLIKFILPRSNELDITCYTVAEATNGVLQHRTTPYLTLSELCDLVPESRPAPAVFVVVATCL